MEVAMPQSAKVTLHQALELPSNDRAALVEGPIASLDKPDPALDAMWLKEAEVRMAAYRAGELEAIDAEQVFADLGKKI
jgi:putative addiction module component (TIGR02574 family)